MVPRSCILKVPISQKIQWSKNLQCSKPIKKVKSKESGSKGKVQCQSWSLKGNVGPKAKSWRFTKYKGPSKTKKTLICILVHWALELPSQKIEFEWENHFFFLQALHFPLRFFTFDKQGTVLLAIFFHSSKTSVKFLQPSSKGFFNPMQVGYTSFNPPFSL